MSIFYVLILIFAGKTVYCINSLRGKEKVVNKFIEENATHKKNLASESGQVLSNKGPIILTTWNFLGATQESWEALTKNNKSAIDAVVEGCSYCERMQCDFTVGFGGSPDENGETTLEAMVFDGDTFNVGAVGGLRRIKNAIGVAKAVMLHSKHTVLVGDAATEFAIKMGFTEESLSTNRSIDVWKKWKESNCQPNFWKNVLPDPGTSCGPYRGNPKMYIFNNISNTGSNIFKDLYRLKKIHKDTSNCNSHIPDDFEKSDTSKPTESSSTSYKTADQDEGSVYQRGNEFSHDTISQIVMDKSGSIVVGTSSNGAQFKIPGRMGDAGIPGASGVADSKVGAAVATGDGDVMMRFSPAALIVERMRNNMSPEKATTQVIKMIKEKFPTFQGAVIALNKNGNFSAACSGIDQFPYSIARSDLKKVKLYIVKCV